jgi:hypothetical protein
MAVPGLFDTPYDYVLSFSAVTQRVEIMEERVENKMAGSGHDDPDFSHRFRYGESFGT